MSRDDPQEPMSQLQEAAAQLHELLLTYVAAGFTRKEAMMLCAEVLRGSFGQGGDTHD